MMFGKNLSKVNKLMTHMCKLYKLKNIKTFHPEHTSLF